jgi:hypothetical protein
MAGQEKLGRLSIFALPKRLSNSDDYKMDDPAPKAS